MKSYLVYSLKEFDFWLIDKNWCLQRDMAIDLYPTVQQCLYFDHAPLKSCVSLRFQLKSSEIDFSACQLDTWHFNILVSGMTDRALYSVRNPHMTSLQVENSVHSSFKSVYVSYVFHIWRIQWQRVSNSTSKSPQWCPDIHILNTNCWQTVF